MAQSTKSNKKQNKQQNKKDKSQKKKAVNKSRSSCFPYLLGIFVLIGAIAGVVSYDVHVSGGGVFEKSATGKFLKDIGALPYVEMVWYKSMSTSARGYMWLEKNAPFYYEEAKVISKPYCGLLVDLYKIVIGALKNIVESVSEVCVNKAPLIADFLDQYVPGLPKKVQDFSFSVWSLSVNLYNSGCDFFKTKVFVGSLSSENLSKAMNQTQIAAAKYYSWFHEKVDAYAKIK